MRSFELNITYRIYEVNIPTSSLTIAVKRQIIRYYVFFHFYFE